MINIMNNDTPIIIEDGCNTSWLVSLIIALFHKSSLDNLLNIFPHDIKMIYIQEFIKHRFLYLLKNKYSIFSDCINNLRNYIIFSQDICILNYLTEKNITDFYEYLIINIDMKYQINLKNKIDADKINKLFYIKLDINNNDPHIVNLNDKLDLYFQKNNNYIDTSDMPLLFPIFINRNNNFSRINMMSKIKLIKDVKCDVYWNIYSFICQNEQGYYVLIKDKNGWVMYNDKKITSNININMNNSSIVDELAQQVVMIFYLIN